MPCVTYEDAFKLREAQATEILATRRVSDDVLNF